MRLLVGSPDWVAAWGHFPCWRPHQTCHLWKLALGLCDVQLSSDFNMSETLTHTVKWPQELAIYGPRPDLWPLRFGKNFEPLSRLNLESYLSSYLWRTIFQLVCGISPYSALLGLTGSFIAFADWLTDWLTHVHYDLLGCFRSQKYQIFQINSLDLYSGLWLKGNVTLTFVMWSEALTGH